MSKTFCVLPWLHAATLPDGTVQLCCVASSGSGINVNSQKLTDYWQSAYVKDVRLHMLAGQDVPACRNCYAEEATGCQSQRLVENRVWRERLGAAAIQELVEQTRPDGSLNAPLQYVDLRLGNTCNLQCVMCQPRESSRWLPAAQSLVSLCRNEGLKVQLASAAAIEPSRFDWSRTGAFWDDLRSFLPGVKEIILAGGEPFLVKEQFEFVKACCELGEADHIRLRYHTNATVFPEQMVPYWRQFDRVHFLVSVDGVGDVANYVRYPSNWCEIDDHIHRFDSIGGNTFTSFLFTAHALNVFHLPDVYDWADESGFRTRKWFAHLQDYVSVGLVHNPPYQHIAVLPAAYKRIVSERLEACLNGRLANQASDKVRALIAVVDETDRSEHLPALLEYITLLDTTRGTSLGRTFPALASHLHDAQERTRPPIECTLSDS